MKAGTNGRVFHYHADANPFGGVVTVPKAHTFDTQGSSSLSQAGGSASGKMSSFSPSHGIVIGGAYSSVTGQEDSTEQAWVTEITSVVEGLDLCGVVKADRISCTMSISHPFADPPYYPSVDFSDCRYDNLRINGQQVFPDVQPDMYSRTAGEVAGGQCSWMDDIHVLAQVEDQTNKLLQCNGPSWLNSRYDWVKYPNHRRTKGHLVCSLVQGFTGLGQGMKPFGHVLEVDNLGFLFFGELKVDQRSFSIAMLRAEIRPTHTAVDKGGSGLGATMGVAVAHTNGSSSP